jgi:glycosyltransferase involved in cell wall biosynthesis
MIAPHFYATYVPSLREGISRNIHALLAALQRAGQDVRLEAPTARLKNLNHRATLLVNGLANHRMLTQALRDPRNDVAHQHVSIASMGLFAQFARLRARSRVPLIVHAWNAVHRREDIHGRIPYADRVYHKLFNNRVAARFGLRNMPAVIVSSEFQARQLRLAGHREALFVIPNGVDTRSYRPATFLERAIAKQDLGVADADLVLLYYGHLSAWKGVDTFLESLPGFFNEHPRAKAIVSHTAYGAGQARLRTNIQTLGISDRVVVHGPQHVPTLLAASDVVVIPPLAPVGTACHPNVLLESLSAGVPVVASRIGSIPEAVEDGRSGLLFQPGNPDDLLRKLLLLGNDRQRRLALGNAARQDALSRFHWDTVAARVKELYELVVDFNVQGRPLPTHQPDDVGDAVPWAA